MFLKYYFKNDLKHFEVSRKFYFFSMQIIWNAKNQIKLKILFSLRWSIKNFQMNGFDDFENFSIQKFLYVRLQ